MPPRPRQPRRPDDEDSASQGPLFLRVSRAEAASKIQARIQEGEELLGFDPADDAELQSCQEKRKTWDDYNTQLLKNLFSNSSISDEYSHLFATSFSMRPTWQDRVEYVRRDLRRDLSRLRSILARLELVEEDPSMRSASPSPTPSRTPGNEIFIVHGRNNEAKETVARFLEHLGRKPIILHEQPNKGRTIIEKFEDYSSVGYAVVLLTPDDVGAVKGQEDVLHPRARQNVILELGYFLGVLGRSRVMPLVVEGVEVPSDLSGVVYVRMDPGGSWKLELAREMKAAGIDVDLNRAI